MPKLAYLFKEKGTSQDNWFCIYTDVLANAIPTSGLSMRIAHLKRDGYKIVDSDVPIDDFVSKWDIDKYREITAEERKRIENAVSNFEAEMLSQRQNKASRRTKS